VYVEVPSFCLVGIVDAKYQPKKGETT